MDVPKALPPSKELAVPKAATLKTPKMMARAPLRSGSNLSVPLLGVFFWGGTGEGENLMDTTDNKNDRHENGKGEIRKKKIV